ncbi:MAG: DNA-binding transcriptional LysR family regulator [Cellvibrionaceae bacterium]|jgi:DNA-binding transcriptional LysR family regulator
MKAAQHLKGLYYFSVSARYLSIKKASEVLHVTQAAVSQKIRLLEASLGVTLFQRRHRSIELTSQGQHLLPIAASAFDNLQRGIDRLSDDMDPLALDG